MSTRSLPWFKFSPDLWQADQALGMCGAIARAVWIECMCVMHKAEPYGHLLVNGKVPNAEQLARIARLSVAEIEHGLVELEAAGVFSRNRNGVIYCRRMVRDHRAAENSRINGQRGGDLDLKHVAAVPRDEQAKRFDRKGNPTKVRAVWEACGGLCTLCNQAMEFEHRNQPNAFEIDHIKPLTQGGGNSLENLRGVCKACNLAEAKRIGKERRLQATGCSHPNPDPNPHPNLKSLESKNKEERPPSGEGGAGGDEPPPAQTETPRKSAGRAGAAVVPLPPGWRPATAMRASIAVKYPSLDIDQETEAFSDNARAHKRTYADWDAAFRNWCRNAAPGGRFAPSATVVHLHQPQKPVRPYAKPNRIA